MLLIISIILIIVSILILIYALSLSKKTHIYNQEIDKQNQQLEKINQKNKKEYENILSSIELQKPRLVDAKHAALISVNGQKELSQKAYENYCLSLEQAYDEKEKEYSQAVDRLNTSYEKTQFEIIDKLNQAQADLDRVQATRTAALQAQLKEKEIKEKLAFYCLTIKDADLDDIKVLERMKSQLHNPRILSMLIWSTYFQKPMTALCNNIIGTGIKSGIYKITNQTNDMCYIGQSVDLARRWKDHAKCGLGIDTPQNNKLYQAMIQDGLWNFSFEILEECPTNELNQKERYYIQLYKSYEFGYNSNAGIK